MEDRNLKGHASLLLAYIIFGLNTPVAKDVLMHEEISAVALTFYRLAGAAALFWLLSLFMHRERVNARDLLTLFGASLFGILINQYTFIIGLSLTSPINASVIVTATPIITMLLAALFLKEPVTGTKITGVFIGASGALALILTGNTDEQQPASIGGNALCLLSSLSFAVYLSAFKKIIGKYSSATLMKWMFLFATACCLPFCWRNVVAVDYFELSASLYLRILFVVGMASFLAYLLIPVGQKRLRPTIVSMYNYVQPVISTLVAVTLGMDQFGWVKGSATALVFLGVYVVTKSKSYAQMNRKAN